MRYAGICSGCGYVEVFEGNCAADECPGCGRTDDVYAPDHPLESFRTLAILGYLNENRSLVGEPPFTVEECRRMCNEALGVSTMGEW